MRKRELEKSLYDFDGETVMDQSGSEYSKAGLILLGHRKDLSRTQ